jgi:hypothetical protein
LEPPGSSVKEIKVEEILADMRTGMRTKEFLTKYGIELAEFQEILKQLIRQGLLSKDEFKAWKAHRPVEAKAQDIDPGYEDRPVSSNIVTYVVSDPEKKNHWALSLFSTKRENMKGAEFKVNLQGKKYSFVVEEMLYRGPVRMRQKKAAKSVDAQTKRQEAIDFISKHGWAAYLENRAFTANFSDDETDFTGKARLVLLHCRNETYLAALHTPAPAINLYVASSLDKIRQRLSRNVDTASLNL